MKRSYRVIDLSHTLYPGKEEYPLEVRLSQMRDVLPQYNQKDGDWYAISEVTFQSHVGTHIEAPYHHVKDGLDVATLPFDRLIGEAVVLDFTHKGENDAITIHDLIQLNDKIKIKDIVLIKTWLDKNYRTERQHCRPYMTRDSVEWLVKEKKIRCLGVDVSGIEDRGEEYQPNHVMLLQNGVPLIEYMANLEDLSKERVWLVVLPLKIVGLESCPVRVVAFEFD